MTPAYPKGARGATRQRAARRLISSALHSLRPAFDISSAKLRGKTISVSLNCRRAAPWSQVHPNPAPAYAKAMTDRRNEQVYFTERFEDWSEATDVRVGVGRCMADNRVPIRCLSKRKARHYPCFR